MASVDGSRSLQGGSDELYDIICGPCQTNRLHKPANHYCKECREYLCNTCKSIHCKLAVSKGHTILVGKHITARIPGRQKSVFVTYCGCNKNQTVEFYCEDHKNIICNPCKMVKHRSCKTAAVREKVAEYTTTRIDSVLTKIKSLIHEFDTMQKQRESDCKKLKRLTEDCKKQIKDFREKIDIALDKLEKHIMNEIDEFDKEQSRHINEDITALTTGLQMLDSDSKQIENAKVIGQKVKVFTTDVQVSQSIQEYEAMLAELEKNMSKPTLSFEENKKLADFQREIKSLGNLKGAAQILSFSREGRKKCKQKMFLGKKATLQNHVNVISSDDKEAPRVSGCAFMPRGHAVLCDHNNSNIKLLDKALVLREHLELCSRPWDISVVNDNNVIITLPDKCRLQYLQVFPQLKAGHTIKLDNQCYGIEVFGDEIYTTQWHDSDLAEIHVLDLNGGRKRAWQTGVELICPHYITVSNSGKRIFVSDGYGNSATVTCLTPDGNLVYQYKDKEMRAPYGMYADAEDNILVCDLDSNTVHVITANGKKYKTLLISGDRIKRPYSLAYREADDTLIMGCKDQKSLFIYKLV